MNDLSNNNISLAGEFAVLSQLALRGFNANMTLGNTKSVDILLTNPVTGNVFKIEVKTHYRNTSTQSKTFGHSLPWMMSQKHEDIIDPKLFYVFVNITHNTNMMRFFVLPSEVVAKYVKEQHAYWLKSGEERGVQDSNMRTFRIGLDDAEYAVPTPLAKEFENKWDYFQ